MSPPPPPPPAAAAVENAAAAGPDDRARLRTHFSSDPTDSSKWDALWTQAYTPWDRGLPNPALSDLLSSRHRALNPPVMAPKDLGDPRFQKIRRPRALVPGCGKGYDVFLLASYGFDAFGVEVSPKAAEAAREEQKRVEGAEEYRVKVQSVGRGEAKILQGDFFKDEWWNESCEGLKDKGFDTREGFELIYDYTFFCALPPQLRSRWARRMAELLTPDGRLICLEFPTYKEPSTGGPPWAVRPVEYVGYLSRPGDKVDYDDQGFVKGVDEENPERTEKGLVRIAHFQPDRTHEIGKGTDWISVWRHQ
ncbi:Hybrid signal transduction protein dokA [Sphaceloma murrayae]|uniref:Hybrid signal transduction protein dokA n=1 Tax=Sphaceloma murrayae TaxID=2082308 RepID=A0A2K1QVX2_9PEZI|nr:Hybrid signal transduction protein dokA [Sphaceloma murrayae]